MKTNFDIDAYLRKSEESYSACDDGAYGWVEEPELPVFNRKRILLLFRLR